MEKLTYNDLCDKLCFFGRCYNDSERQAIYFNWSLSGFEVSFEGKTLNAYFNVIQEMLLPGPVGVTPLPEYPCIGIFVDGDTELNFRMELKEDGVYTLFSGEYGRHNVRVIKLSEEFRGKNGLSFIETDGCFLKTFQPIGKLRMEFIGDSITCGYGNESPPDKMEFCSKEENGWLTYGAIAARKLNAEAKYICISGITLTDSKIPRKSPFNLPLMENIYTYTDKPYEDKQGITVHKEWNFKENPSDIVILNLGTNDHTAFRFAGCLANIRSEEKHFMEHYYSFIKLIRKKNGKDTLICCCLGPMEHYLYDLIKDTVRQYVENTGDKKIISFKFDSIALYTEGIGAAGHPSLITHARMADELVDMVNMEYKALQWENCRET